uniref:hypothetical protein n=1 Tax=Flavobacterium sp. TaxID=239 RepID=UPI0040495A3C
MKILKRTQEVISVFDKIQDYSEKTSKFFGKVCNQCDQLLSKEEESTHQTLGQGTRDSISTNPKR